MLDNKYPGVYQVLNSKGEPVEGKYNLRITYTVRGKTYRHCETIGASSPKVAYQTKILITERLKNSNEGVTGNENTFFDQLWQMWIENRINEYSPTSMDGYVKIYRGGLKDYFDEMQVSKISKADINRYLDYIKKRNPSISNRTVRNHLMLIRTLLNFAVDYDIVNKNVALDVKTPKVVKQEQNYFNDQQMIRIIELLDEEVDNFINDENNKLRYNMLRILEVKYKRLFIMLCIVTGCRRGELCGIRWKDINFEKPYSIKFKGTLYKIDGQDSKYKDNLKNGNTEKQIYIPDKIIELLQDIKDYQKYIYKELDLGEPEYVFVTLRNDKTCKIGSPARPNSYSHWFHAFCEEHSKELGLTDKGGHLHMLRHSYISFNANHGVSVKLVSDLAGHSDSSVTLNYYTHTSDEQKIQAAEMLNNLLLQNSHKEKDGEP